MRVSKRFQVLFIIFVVLGVFYPALFGGLYLNDDLSVVSFDLKDFSLRGLFTPGNGFYYRPLLVGTYFLDKFLWDSHPGTMHLENVLFHAGNALLTYLLALQVFARIGRGSELALLAALLFALHPVNTESANWISGRSDLMATFFVLLALLAVLRGVRNHSFCGILLAAFLFLAGVLSKEVALFFFPVLCGFLLFWPADDAARPTRRGRLLLTFSAPYALLAVTYFVVRRLHYAGSDSASSFLAGSTRYDFLDTLRVVLKVVGFYVKKLFVPVPLNFATVEVSDWYAVVGAIALPAAAYLLFRKRRTWSVFALISLYLIVPAVLIAYVGVAWTPVAERYLYLPSVFFCIALVAAVHALGSLSKRPGLSLPLLGTVLGLFVIATVQRNIVWQTPLSLYEDTARKSPGCLMIRNELGVALMEAGREEEALQSFAEGRKSIARNSYLNDLNEARLYLGRGEYERAREALFSISSDKAALPVNALKLLARIDEKRLLGGGQMDMETFLPDLLDTYDCIYSLEPDPYFLYRSGQLALTAEDTAAAGTLFAQAYRMAHPDSHYREAAGTLAKRLGAQ